MPRVIFLLNGKRKSGKDFVAEKLKEQIPESVIIRLSEPIKSEYASRHGLDLALLLSSSEYKEKYRADMVAWSEALRDSDPGVFCRPAVQGRKEEEKYRADMVAWSEALRDSDPGVFCRPAVQGRKEEVWIVSDCRRPSDIAFFRQNYAKSSQVITVRTTASESVRQRRGFLFTPGIDDRDTECALDDMDCDVVIQNDEDAVCPDLKCLLDVALK